MATKDLATQSDASSKERFVPQQFQVELWPWQKTVEASCDVLQEEDINVIYDPVGCTGKTTVEALCCIHGKAINPPRTTNAKTLMRSLYVILATQNLREPKAIFVEIPKFATQKQMKAIFLAIQDAKHGRVYASRPLREWFFETPTVWVFCNKLPNFELLPTYKFWTIKDKELHAFDFKPPSSTSPTKCKRKLDSK